MPVSDYRDDMFLKFARETVHPLKGRAKVCEKEIAGRIGTDYENVSNWIQGWRAFTPERIVAFTRAAENPMMLEAMAEACGYLLVPLPSGEDVGMESIPRVVQEFADLVKAACEAVRDGTISSEEAEEVRLRALVAVRAEYQLVLEMDNRVAARRPSLFERARTLAAAEGFSQAGRDVPQASDDRLHWRPGATPSPAGQPARSHSTKRTRKASQASPRGELTECDACLMKKGRTAFHKGHTTCRACEAELGR
jgi:hypothetical protein